VVFAIVIWSVGRPVSEAESTKVIGYVGEKTPAAEAGLKVGDEIESVDGHKVTRYQGMSSDSIQWSIVRSEGDQIPIVVEREVNGAKEQETIWVKPQVPEKANWWNRKNLRVIGIGPATSSIVAEVTPDTAAARAGLKKDDIITAINGQKLYGPEGIYDYAKAHPADSYQFTVERGSTPLTLTIEPKGVRVAGVEKDSPASAAGLQKDDVVIGLDDQKTNLLSQLIDYIGSRANVPVAMHIERAGKPLEIKVTPQIPIGLPADAEKLGKIGAVLEGTDGLAFEGMGKTTLVHPGPVEQVRLSVMAIVNTLDAVLSRKSSVSVQHMGGPVMMMNAYYHMLSSPEGVRMAIWFSVVLNVNLALLNLLPIPVLDGGHITLAILEAVRRKPMNVRVLEYVQTACALVIIGFMLFIMFFDVQDLPFIGAKRPTLHFQKAGEEPAR